MDNMAIIHIRKLSFNWRLQCPVFGIHIIPVNSVMIILYDELVISKEYLKQLKYSKGYHVLNNVS